MTAVRKRMWLCCGIGLFLGHRVNLSVAKGAKSHTSFEVWGVSLYRFGFLFWSRWVP